MPVYHLHIPSFFLGCVCMLVVLWAIFFLAEINERYRKYDEQSRDRPPDDEP
jgi:hypothetical protein